MTASRLWQPAFWGAYWVTLRPYLFFVSGVSGFVGLALNGGASPATVAAAFLAFFFSYGLGQALTDVFQTDTDALSAPYRPLVRGTIRRGDVLAVSLCGLALSAGILAWLSIWTVPLAGAGVAGLLSYTWAKRRPLLGPAWNAAVVALLPAIGLTCEVRSLPRALAHPLLPAAAASVFFSYAIFVLLGYFKDVAADRATGYVTLPVRFGRRAASATSAAVFLSGTVVASGLLVLHCGALYALSPARLAALSGWVVGLALLALAHVRIARTHTDEAAHPAIAMVVRGYVALHSSEAALLRPDFVAPLVVFYLLFEATLRRRPSQTQI